MINMQFQRNLMRNGSETFDIKVYSLLNWQKLLISMFLTAADLEQYHIFFLIHEN